MSEWKSSFQICTYTRKGFPTFTDDLTDKESVEEVLEKYLDMDLVSVTLYASEMLYDLSSIHKLTPGVKLSAKAAAFFTTGDTKLEEAIKRRPKRPFSKSENKTEEELQKMKAYPYQFGELFAMQEEANRSSLIHHDFVLVEARKEKSYFLTFEKMPEFLVIQATEKEDIARHCYLSKDPNRKLYKRCLETDLCRPGLKVQSVIDRLYSQKELEKVYSEWPSLFSGDHCQHYSQRVFEFLAKEKKYPERVKIIDEIFFSLKEDFDEKRMDEMNKQLQAALLCEDEEDQRLK